MGVDFSNQKSFSEDVGGYAGRILEVDLSTKSVSLRKIESAVLRQYIGGIGIAAYFMWVDGVVEVEPFAPENQLMFFTGPLTGTSAPSSSRCSVAAISPMTGIWGEAHFGGDWPYELKMSGFDGLIIKGVSDNPVYLKISDCAVDIVEAEHLWGLNTFECEKLLKEACGDSHKVLCIGRAGENKVTFAGIISEPHKGRAAARCGLGALMGQKMLKAIVVNGTVGVKEHDEEAIMAVSRGIVERRKALKALKQKEPAKPDAPKGLENIYATGGAPIRNWKLGHSDDAKTFVKKMTNRVNRQQNCRRCSIKDVESCWTSDNQREMVWESWGLLGLNCEVYDEHALQKAYLMCNDYGLDTISAGNTIAFSFECFEKGIISLKDTDGIELTWGNADTVLKMIQYIGEAKGIGVLLGKGVRNAAEELGGLAKEYSVHVKGLDLPAHDPRASNAFALAYATGSYGATHVQVLQLVDDYYDGNFKAWENPEFGYPKMLPRFDTEGKGELVYTSQNYGDVLDSLVSCKYLVVFGKARPSDFVKLLNAVTGWDVTIDELMKCGERIFNLRRMINIFRGISRKDDTLPPRILTEKKVNSKAENNLPFLGEMLNDYYEKRNWTKDGIPTRDKLEELNILDIIDNTRKRGKRNG